jgi:apolipoprotein N-acyltransferase
MRGASSFFMISYFADEREGRKTDYGKIYPGGYSAAVMNYTKMMMPLTMIALGGLSALGFAPLGWWPVTLIALAVLMHVVDGTERMLSAFARGYWFGVGHFIVGLNWIAGAFAYQDSMPVWIGWVAVVLLALYIAVYPAMAAAVAWRFGRPAIDASSGDVLFWLQNPFALVFAAAWIATEYLRATVFTGFAWNPLGVIMIDLPLLPTAMAPTIGTYGLSGFVVLIAGLISFGIGPWFQYISKHRHDGTWPTYVIAPAMLASLSVIWVGMVAGDVKYRERDKPAGPLLRIVQPNIGQQDKHIEAFAEVNFAKLARLSGKPGPTPRLILWPEAAVPDYLEEEEWARERVAALLGPNDMLLTGGTALIYDRKGLLTAARNSVFAVTPGAKLVARYDKAHLVPYGEYLALRWLLEPLGATRLVPGTVDFLAGPGARSLAVPGFGKVGVQICYEIIFSGEVIDRANRPDFLFNPSNDAWFGSWGPPQHLAQARLRAIEEGISVVRSTPTGISAIIDPDGRVLRSLPYRKAGFIEARLPRSDPPTTFARYGNIIPFGLALLLFALGIALRQKRR